MTNEQKLKAVTYVGLVAKIFGAMQFIAVIGLVVLHYTSGTPRPTIGLVVLNVILGLAYILAGNKIYDGKKTGKYLTLMIILSAFPLVFSLATTHTIRPLPLVILAAALWAKYLLFSLKKTAIVEEKKPE